MPNKVKPKAKGKASAADERKALKDYGALPMVECVDADGRTTALPPMTQPRHGHGAGVVGGRAYALLGGEIPGLNATDSVEWIPVD